MLISLGVLRRKKNAQSLLADLKVNGPTLLEELEVHLGPHRRDDQEAPDYQAQIDEFDHLLANALADLQGADDVHLVEVKKDRALRKVRDEKTVKLHRVLVDASITIDRNHGSGTAEDLLGLGTGILAIPDHVEDLTRRAVGDLEAPGFAFPGPGLEGVPLNPDNLRTQLEEPLAELAAAIQDVREQKRRFNNTLRRKRLAIEIFDRVYSIVADWLKAMYRAAGLDGLAERVRPTIPKASRASDDEVVEDETAEEGSAAAGASSAGATAEASIPESEGGDETPMDEASPPVPEAEDPAEKEGS